MNIQMLPFIDFLRVFAIALVLLVHACECFYFNDAGEFHIASAGDAFWGSAIDSACRAAVPLFVMVSGYLLFPLKCPAGQFFRRRLSRVLVPFVLWCGVYIWHTGGDWRCMAFNFPMTAGGHLWFVPMILGVYLLMPLLSPWAERVTKREVQFYLGVWLFTTMFPYLRKLCAAVCGDPIYGVTPFLYGECPWNGFGTFQYASGFIGYMLLGFYFRKFVGEWSWRRALTVAVPLFALGYAIVAGGFYFRIPGGGVFPVTRPYATAVDMETTWEFCSLGVALTTLGYFVVARQLNWATGGIYQCLIRPAAAASYGVYLTHMLILIPVIGWVRPQTNTPLCIFATAAITLIIAAAGVLLLRKIPKLGKLICG